MQIVSGHGFTLCASRVVIKFHKSYGRFQHSVPPWALLSKHSRIDEQQHVRILNSSGRLKTGPWNLNVRSKSEPALVDFSCNTAVTPSHAFVDGVLGVPQQYGDSDSQTGTSDMIFLGTGTSEGVPRVSCLTHTSVRCPVCWGAAQLGNKNRRRNTSLLVRYVAADGIRRNILIDAGKFFYHSALQWFPHYGIRNLDSVIITHSHADAVGGLDDLRDWTNNVQDSIPIYVAQRDIEVLSKSHYYLVDPSVITKGTAVSKLQFKLITEEPFYVHGLKVTPLPVWHGPGYRSLGFRVGNVCYISDVSEIPEETYPLLENCELLILDAVRPDRSTITHFGLPQALEEVRKIRPQRTLFTGMMHTMDHDKINARLEEIGKEEGLDMQLSFDGMRIPITI
ncbi:hypothetical protein Mapa_015143 [Marchantia paleacea]|nr:hypothetical protein Mapa_015143 [Marchantia paleacea]